ncbi:MAG TPA: FGGY family carbohydrate kinase [Solirubrobacteraceae bacterium]|nr:FGGY family carbohydrate kinase [Solirubrobacteraceae bacterium]
MLLGIDIGSSAVKAALVEPETGVIAFEQSQVALHSPRPGWAEADTAEWWTGVCRSVAKLVGRGGHGAGNIEAVACSGMVPAVLPLDLEGRPLRRAILQNDARATLQLDELRQLLEDLDLVNLTGSALTQQSVAPTLRWIAENEPDVLEDTVQVTGSYDWVARRLGAESHVERNWAIESGLFKLDGSRMHEVLERAQIDGGLLPPVRDPATVIGEVSSQAAEETGLHAGTPIVVGGADHVFSAYGAGLVAPGDWLVKLGGAGDILVVSGDPLVDERLFLDAHPAGQWLPNGCMATSGSLVRWLAGLAGGAPLEVLDDEAARTPVGAGGVLCLPYFLGEKSPLQDPALRGAFVGLHLGHTRAHLHRAALEAVAFGFRHHVEVFRERSVALGEARVTNGGSSSRLWKQILADVLATPLHPVLDHPGAAFGAALAAGVGSGVLPAGWDTIRSLVRLGDPIEPQPEATRRYEELYGLYRELGGVLTPISHRLAREAFTK